MKSTQYLYGIRPVELENKMYFEALQYKYDACTALYRTLYLKHNKTEEEDVQMFHVERAQKFTKRLLDERVPKVQKEKAG